MLTLEFLSTGRIGNTFLVVEMSPALGFGSDLAIKVGTTGVDNGIGKGVFSAVVVGASQFHRIGGIVARELFGTILEPIFTGILSTVAVAATKAFVGTDTVGIGSTSTPDSGRTIRQDEREE